MTTKGIKPLSDKLEMIAKFAEPKNKRELQQFLGMCTFYRQFTVKHSELINPFRKLLGDKGPWEWTTIQLKAFENMKSAFVKCVELSHFIPEARFKLQTDASDVGVSSVLYQCDGDGNHRVISLVSRCLNSAEMNYTTTEKELLAILYSISKLRVYLLGTQFDVITDHKGLIFLQSTAYHNARLIHWSLFLQQYDFVVSYCRGKDNVVADFFSRNPRGKFECQGQNQLSIDVLEIGVESDANDCSLCEIDL